MRLENFKNYQQVHIWTGIVSGLLLFICFVAGALTMFKAPLNQWALQAQTQLPEIQYQQYDSLIQQVLIAHPEAAREMTVYLPSAMPKSAPLVWVVEDPQTHATTTWHASLDEQGQLVSESTHISAIGDFLDHLHRTGGIPGGDEHDAYGIFVMGLVCVLYFVALISGLIIFLPTWFKDLFAVRRDKNSRRFWVDFHNILGISALPFHIVIAVTTIVFAYHDLLYGAMQQLVYQDTPMFNRAPAEAIDRDFSRLVSVDQLAQQAQSLEPELQPEELRFAALGTPGSRVIVGGTLDGEWIRGPEYAFMVSDPYTGKPGYTAMLPSVSGFMGKFVNGFFTLHFGGFGGGLVHWLYFAMGITGSLLFLTGNIIWIESRRKKSSSPHGPQRSVRILSRLTVGVTAGTLVGIAAALLLAKCLPHHEWDISWVQQLGYYAGFLFCMAMAFLLPPLTATRHLLTLFNLMLAALIGSTLWFANGPLTAVDLGVSLICVLAILCSVATSRHLQKRADLIPTDRVWA